MDDAFLVVRDDGNGGLVLVRLSAEQVYDELGISETTMLAKQLERYFLTMRLEKEFSTHENGVLTTNGGESITINNGQEILLYGRYLVDVNLVV